MRSRWLVTVVALALTGAVTSCDDDSISGLDETFEDEATWEATLGPEGVTTSATGRAWFVDRGNTIDFLIEYNGLTSPTTNAHIHRETTQGVMVQLPFVRQATGGTVVGTIDMTRLNTAGTAVDVAPLENGDQSAADFRAALNSGATYVNIHSQTFTQGEIRGTISPR